MNYNYTFFFALLISTTALSQETKPKFNADCRFDFEVPRQEVHCFDYFDDTASGVNNANAFILAKMSEMMYLERLDYQIRYLQNDCSVVDDIPSSDWIKEHSLVDDANFEDVFVERFQHYFSGKFEANKAPNTQNNTHKNKDYVQFRYIQKTHTEDAHFFGVKHKQSLDPELMVISTPTMILILFRGTDNVKKLQWAEWTGTDLRINQMNAGGALVGTKLHTGFWLSFDLIRDELIATLAEFEAEKKNIWVAGHSLGAALSVVTGAYLKASDYNVQNVYAFACPRTIGNKKFVKKANKLLPNRIQRFEYFQDPITILWAAGFHYEHVGQRNWYDEETKGNYKLYKKSKERVYVSGGLDKYPYIQADDIKEQRRIKRNQQNAIIFWGMGSVHYHNPQWYVKAAYEQLTEAEKDVLPLVEDSYPYLYFGKKGTK